jgi:Cdc6-like AAA superfamily ATPase
MEQQLTDFLKNFELHGRDKSTVRCAYIYGVPGTGKTTFAHRVLQSNGYDCISFTAADTRNKIMVEALDVYSIACSDVMSSFMYDIRSDKRKIAVLMDEIECMNTGDKGGINALIKLVRPKRTKKQKLEESMFVPVICIGTASIDKKIKIVNLLVSGSAKISLRAFLNGTFLSA